MKKNQAPQVEADQAELITNLNGSPFVISGTVELIQDMYQQELANYKSEPHRSPTSRRTRKVASMAVEQATKPLSGLLGRVATDLKVVAYDKTHGTHFYTALQEKRADERNLRFATSIGLISLSDVTCRKHEHAVAAMRGLDN